jgi:hypothetical protein
MTEQEFLATSRNGVKVYYDPVESHAATHIADTPQLKSLAIEVIGKTDIQGEVMEFETDMGRVVGNTDGVVNEPSDIIVYAKRKNRDEYTPFNKSKSSQPSRFVTLALKRQPNGNYELLSAFVSPGDTLAGEPSPPFPGQPNEAPNSREYWTKHSLAWGTQEIQEGTETSVCPW